MSVPEAPNTHTHTHAHTKNNICGHHRIVGAYQVIDRPADAHLTLGSRRVSQIPAVGTPVPVLDMYVAPPGGADAVMDFRTAVSGVERQHLEGATMDVSMARRAVAGVIRAEDYVVGHSLDSDLKALELWHANVVDTALLFEVSGHPRWTLALADVVSHVFDSSSNGAGAGGGVDGGGAGASFRSGASAGSLVQHDSVEDAEWAARVVAHLVSLRASAAMSEDKFAAAVWRATLLPGLPAHYSRRLTMMNLPPASDETVVRGLFGPHAGDVELMRPIKWFYERRKGKGREGDKGSGTGEGGGKREQRADRGAKRGSTIVEFRTSESAAAAFKALGAGRGDAYWPDEEAFMRVDVPLWIANATPDEGQPASAAVGAMSAMSFHLIEVRSYTKVSYPFTGSTKIGRASAGKLVGKGGARIKFIRRVARAVVTLHKEVGSSGFQVVDVRAQSEAAREEALSLVNRAAQGERVEETHRQQVSAATAVAHAAAGAGDATGALVAQQAVAVAAAMANSAGGTRQTPGGAAAAAAKAAVAASAAAKGAGKGSAADAAKAAAAATYGVTYAVAAEQQQQQSPARPSPSPAKPAASKPRTAAAAAAAAATAAAASAMAARAKVSKALKGKAAD